jgi:hypothetical protein
MLAFWLPIMLTQEEAVEIKVLMRRDAGIREMARACGLAQYDPALFTGAGRGGLRTETATPNQA